MTTSLRLALALTLGALLTGCPPTQATGQEPPAPLVTSVEWETLQAPVSYYHVHRTRVPGGWLVASKGNNCGDLVYIPDPDGQWLMAPETAPRTR